MPGWNKEGMNRNLQVHKRRRFDSKGQHTFQLWRRVVISEDCQPGGGIEENNRVWERGCRGIEGRAEGKAFCVC